MTTTDFATYTPDLPLDLSPTFVELAVPSNVGSDITASYDITSICQGLLMGTYSGLLISAHPDD